MADHKPRIFTAGHSTRTEQEFLDLVYPAQVVMDIRSHPTSVWTQYRRENLQRWVPQSGREYRWEPRLGGWSEQHHADPELAERMARNGVDLRAYAGGHFPKDRIGRSAKGGEPGQWTNQGLLDYSWFTTLPQFQEAAAELVELSRIRPVAIFCAEALWWKCHRSLVADYLFAVHGVVVQHLSSSVRSYRPAGKPTGRPPGLRWSMRPHEVKERLDRYPSAVMLNWTDAWQRAGRPQRVHQLLP